MEFHGRVVRLTTEDKKQTGLASDERHIDFGRDFQDHQQAVQFAQKCLHAIDSGSVTHDPDKRQALLREAAIQRNRAALLEEIIIEGFWQDTLRRLPEIHGTLDD